MTPITQMLAAVALSVVVVIALWQSGEQGLTVGGFVAYITAMLMLIAPIRRLADMAEPITRGLAALERGVVLIDDVRAGVGRAASSSNAPRGHIELRDVRVHYRGEDEPRALDGVEPRDRARRDGGLRRPVGRGQDDAGQPAAALRAAERAARCCSTGTTPRMASAELRAQFAMVSQDVVMLNDTLAANVALGADIDRERVRNASPPPTCSHVEGLPQGIDTVLGHNATQLSGGQRQRLAIARALYKDAPILLLDEATSALDTESERLVQDALERLMQGRTTLIVAHRLSTIQHADRIVVIEHGRIAEQGSHAQLMAAGRAVCAAADAGRAQRHAGARPDALIRRRVSAARQAWRGASSPPARCSPVAMRRGRPARRPTG